MTFELSPLFTAGLTAPFSDDVSTTFQVLQIEAARSGDEVQVTARLSITGTRSRAQIWELTLDYPEADAVHAAAAASQEEADWFTFMFIQHVIEWWSTKDQEPESNDLGRRIR